MRVTVIPVKFSVLGTIPRDIEMAVEVLEIRGRNETILITALLRMGKIIRRVLETWCHSDSSEKPTAYTDVKNSHNNDKTDKWYICKPEDEIHKFLWDFQIHLDPPIRASRYQEKKNLSSSGFCYFRIKENKNLI